MVQVSAAVVANRRANRFGNRVEVGDEFFDRFVGQLRRLFERGVEVGDVSVVVLVVMKGHRFFVDVWLQRVIRVGQGGS
jgi:hypothetical protein